MGRVEDGLRRIFTDRAERIQQALEQSAAERRRIAGAASRYEEASRELPNVRSRLSQLPAAHSAAVLRRDDAAQERIQSEHDRLIERKAALEAEMEKAARDLGSDPFTAESLSLQRVQALASEEVREAKRQRDRLVAILDEEIGGLEEWKAEAAQLRPTYQRVDKEAS